MRLTGHYKRHDEEIAFKLVPWQPDRERTNGKRTTLVNTLLNDRRYSTTHEQSTVMARERWKSRTSEVRLTSGRGRGGRLTAMILLYISGNKVFSFY